MVVSSVSAMESKRMMSESLFRWLSLHDGEVNRWIFNNIAEASREEFKRMIFSSETSALIMYSMLEQNRTANTDKIISILEPLAKEKGKLFLVTGSKGSGKTSLAYMLCQVLHAVYGVEIWWFGPPCRMPPFMKDSTMDIKNVPADATCLLDEAAVQFTAGPTGGDDLLQSLPILRHSGKNFIVCTQSTSLSSLNFVRNCDAILFKTYSVFQDKTERFKLSDELKFFMPTKKEDVLYFDNQNILFFSYGLPKWWSHEYSTPYAPFRSKAEEIRFVMKLLPELESQKIVDQLKYRASKMELLDVMNIRMMVDYLAAIPKDDKELVKTMERGFDDTPINRLVRNGGIGSMIKGDFVMSPIEEEEAKKECENSLFFLAAHRNINGIVMSDLQYRSDAGRNSIISVYGPTGSGKSWDMLSLMDVLAYIYGKKPDPDNVSFEVNRMIGRLKDVKEKNTLSMDEQIATFGPGSMSALKELQNIEETMRKRQINMIYCSPTARQHEHHYKLRTFGIDKDHKIAKLLVYVGNDSLPIGYITLAAPPKSLVEPYERKKDKFLDMVEKRNTGNIGYLKGLAQKLVETDEWNNARTQAMKLTAIGILHPTLSSETAKRLRDIAQLYYSQPLLKTPGTK